MAKNKTLKVLSTGTVAGMITAAILSSQAFAAVDAYTVKIGSDVLKYDKAALTESFLASKAGEAAPLFEDFTAKLTQAKGFYAFSDAKTGKYVSYDDIQAKFLAAKAAGEAFVVDSYTESKDAKVIEVPTVKKAVVKDGKVSYTTETTEVETEDLVIASVQAPNLKQIFVTFNQVVTDEDLVDEIEDESNYEFEALDDDNDDPEVESVELDGKVAKITLKDGKVAENQAEYTLTIDGNILGKDTDKKVKFVDTTLPEAEKVEVIGVNAIKVTFSEPIAVVNKDDFEINDGDLNIKAIEKVSDNKEVNITLYSDLEDGDQISLEVKNGVEDYAGFSVINTAALKATVKAEASAPKIVGIKDTSRTEVTLVFDKDIRWEGNASDADLDLFYHTNSKNTADVATIDGNELTLEWTDKDSDGDYTKELPDGTAYIYIDDEAIEDYWENENDKIVYKAEITEDKDAPEVKKVEQEDDVEDKFTVTFTEEVDEDSATDKDNYTVLDKDGDELKIDEIDFDSEDKDNVTVTMRENMDSGEYTLVVEGVEDEYENEMNEQEIKFTMEDESPISWDDVSIQVYNNVEDEKDDDQKIVIDFDNEMTTDDSKYSVDDLDKYVITIDGTDYVASDLYDASIKVIKDGKAVEIALPYDSEEDDSYDLADLDSITISRVADAEGNYTKELSKTFAIGDIDMNETVDVDSVKAVDTDTIELTFKDEVDFDDDDVSFLAGTTTLDIAKIRSTTNSDGNTVVTFELADVDDEDALSYNGRYAGAQVKLIIDGDKTENQYGSTLEQYDAADNKYVSDKIAPALVDDREDAKENELDDVELVKDEENSSATITLTFTEALDASSISNVTFDVMNGADEVDATKSIALKTGDATKVVITLTNIDEDDVDDMDEFDIIQKAPIEDLAGNEVEGISTQPEFIATAAADAAVTGALAEVPENVDATITADEDQITVTVADEDKDLAITDLITVADIDAALIPSEVDGVELSEDQAEAIAEVQEIILAKVLENVSEERAAEIESIDDITLEDLEGVSLQVLIGGELVTLAL